MSRRASRSQCGGLQIVATLFLCPVAILLLSRGRYAPIPWWICSYPLVNSHDWGNGCWREALPIGMPLTADGTRRAARKKNQR